jgi:hypothetical protein
MIRDYELCVIRPITLTDAMLTSSNVAETAGTSDPAAWASGTNYTAGQQVSRIGANQHQIWQALTNMTPSTVAPESDGSDPPNWAYVGPTNRWKMFDAVNETQTTKSGSIQVVVTPGQVADAVGMDNLAALNASVAVASGYNRSKSLRSRICRSWYDFFFAPFLYRRSALFVDLPPLSGNVITITVDGGAGTAKAGTVVIGRKKSIGMVEAGAAAGIIDYSKRTTDDFGNTTITKRAYSKRMTLQVLINNNQIDDLEQFLADYRATALYWSIAGKRDAFSFMGSYKSFEIAVSYPDNSIVNLEVESLV